jgi:uncharacterized protein YcbK (DUF882 family)
MEMKITENFSLDEMLFSQAATRLNIEEQFKPSEAVIENLKKLCINILQPLRDKINLPIVVTSGYRCKRTNKAIGGKINSQHIEGKAADIHAIGITNLELLHFIEKNFEFDQLINEFPVNGEPSWVHVSYDAKRMRKMVLTIK